MINWFAKNSVAANFLLLFILALGAYSTTTQLPLEVFPESELEVVSITVTQRASAPEDMETGVTHRIEESIADLPYIDELKSRSSEQTSIITVHLDTGTDTQKALNEIKSRVDAISNLPNSAERPIIKIPIISSEVLTLVVYGDIDEKEMATIARQLRDDIVRVPGISQADIEGIRPLQISIEVSPSVLRAYNLTLDQIAQKIDSQAIDLSAGQIRSTTGDILLRSKNQAYNFEDYHKIVIKRFADGAVITLGDIATINDAFDENPIISKFNGQPSALIHVSRVGKESAISVSNAVTSFLKTEQGRYPDTVKLAIWDDDSRIVRERLNTLLNSGWQGAILIVILLTLFLHPTVALWVVVGIPVCFAGALALFPMMGLTLNIVSMFSFILVLGVVVDDAIVTGENIYSHRALGADGLTAAIKGTQEVAVPVIFGIVTTMLAFVPMLLLDGEASTFGDNIGGAVIITLMFSLIESKLILPAHLSTLSIHTTSKSRPKILLDQARTHASGGLDWCVEHIYRPTLKRSLKHRYLTLLSFICLLCVVLSLSTQGWIRFTFMPIVNAEKATAEISFPAGTPLNITREAIDRLERAAFDMRRDYQTEDGASLINNIISTLGAQQGGRKPGASNIGRVRFEVNQALIDESDTNINQLVKEWRERVGPIVGADQLNYRSQLFRAGSPVSVQLYGNDSEKIQQVIDKIREYLNSIEGVFDITDSMQDGKSELLITLKPEAELLDLHLQDVTHQVRNAFFGIEAQRIQRGQDDIRVMVLYPYGERTNLDQLDNLLITTPKGEQARFGDIATVKWGRSPSAILHHNQLRTAEINADIDRDKVIQNALISELDEYTKQLLQHYPGIKHTMEGEASVQKETNKTLTYGLIGLLLSIFALLAIAFKSYYQPFIVMSVIPFSLIGAILGHVITNVGLSLFSTFGMLALVGVVVNDSLVLVDWINRRLAKGEPIEEVVMAAGKARFRAVLLTSLTTFVGLLPILFQTSTGAQFLIPMATSLGFGIIFATAITLILVPCNYLMIDDIRKMKQRIFDNRSSII